MVEIRGANLQKKQSRMFSSTFPRRSSGQASMKAIAGLGVFFLGIIALVAFPPLGIIVIIGGVFALIGAGADSVSKFSDCTPTPTPKPTYGQTNPTPHGVYGRADWTCVCGTRLDAMDSKCYRCGVIRGEVTRRKPAVDYVDRPNGARFRLAGTIASISFIALGGLFTFFAFGSEGKLPPSIGILAVLAGVAGLFVSRLSGRVDARFPERWTCSRCGASDHMVPNHCFRCGAARYDSVSLPAPKLRKARGKTVKRRRPTDGL